MPPKVSKKRKSDSAAGAKPKKGAKRARVSTPVAVAAAGAGGYPCREKKCRDLQAFTSPFGLDRHLYETHKGLAVCDDCGTYGPVKKDCADCESPIMPTSFRALSESDKQARQLKADLDAVVVESLRLAREKKEATDRAAAAETKAARQQIDNRLLLRAFETAKVHADRALASERKAAETVKATTAQLRGGTDIMMGASAELARLRAEHKSAQAEAEEMRLAVDEARNQLKTGGDLIKKAAAEMKELKAERKAALAAAASLAATNDSLRAELKELKAAAPAVGSNKEEKKVPAPGDWHCDECDLWLPERTACACGAGETYYNCARCQESTHAPVMSYQSTIAGVLMYVCPQCRKKCPECDKPIDPVAGEFCTNCGEQKTLIVEATKWLQQRYSHCDRSANVDLVTRYIQDKEFQRDRKAFVAKLVEARGPAEELRTRSDPALAYMQFIADKGAAPTAGKEEKKAAAPTAGNEEEKKAASADTRECAWCYDEIPVGPFYVQTIKKTGVVEHICTDCYEADDAWICTDCDLREPAHCVCDNCGAHEDEPHTVCCIDDCDFSGAQSAVRKHELEKHGEQLAQCWAPGCEANVDCDTEFCEEHREEYWVCGCGTASDYDVIQHCAKCPVEAPEMCAVADCDKHETADDRSGLCAAHKADHWFCQCGNAFSDFDKLTGCFQCGNIGDPEAWAMTCDAKGCGDFKAASWKYLLHAAEKHDGKAACSFCGDPSASTVAALGEHLVSKHGFCRCGFCSDQHKVFDPAEHEAHYNGVHPNVCMDCDDPIDLKNRQDFLDHKLQVHGRRVCEFKDCTDADGYFFEYAEYQTHLIGAHDQTLCRACETVATSAVPAVCPKCAPTNWVCTDCDTLNRGSLQQCGGCKKRWRCPVPDCKAPTFKHDGNFLGHAVTVHNWYGCHCGRVMPTSGVSCNACASSGSWKCKHCSYTNSSNFDECQNFQGCPSHFTTRVIGSWMCPECKHPHPPTWVCNGVRKSPDNTAEPGEGPFEFRCADCNSFHTNDEDHYKRHKNYFHNAWGMEGAGSGAQ